jgi:lysophospholipase L1-like esterase
VKQILVYADSLSWGIIPGTRDRFEFNARWPGVLEHELTAGGQSVRVLEDCLNGRRTVWDDPFKEGRNGIVGLSQTIEKHSPLSLVILMLGTNDFQSMHPHNVWHASQGIAALVTTIRQAPVEPGMPIPPILVVAPPPITNPKGAIAPKFLGAEKKCEGVAGEYRKVAEEMNCHFFDSATATSSSSVDGVHLDREQQQALGKSIARVAAPLIR